MGLQTKFKTIDGKEFKCTQMSASDALRSQIYLTKILSPFLSQLSNLTDKTALHLVPKLLAEVDDEKFFSFFQKTCEEAFIADKRVNFNIDFSGDLSLAYKCFVFVIETNFADFIKDAVGIDIRELMEKATASR
jgi:hypothetical protein